MGACRRPWFSLKNESDTEPGQLLPPESVDCFVLNFGSVCFWTTPAVSGSCFWLWAQGALLWVSGIELGLAMGKARVLISVCLSDRRFGKSLEGQSLSSVVMEWPLKSWDFQGWRWNGWGDKCSFLWPRFWAQSWSCYPQTGTSGGVDLSPLTR